MNLEVLCRNTVSIKLMSESLMLGLRKSFESSTVLEGSSEQIKTSLVGPSKNLNKSERVISSF